PEAVEAPLVSAELPSDAGLDFVRRGTMKTLEPYWKNALAAGKMPALATEAGARYLLHSLTIDELLKMKPGRAVWTEVLVRPGVRDERRQEALVGLAREEHSSEIRVLLDAIRGQDVPGREETVDFDLLRLLTNRSASELAAARGELEKMATSAKLPV